MTRKSPSKREQAKALYMKGLPDTEIAKKVGCHRNTPKRWRDEDGWDKIRDSLPEEPESLRVISFDRDRSAKRKEPQISPLPNLSSLEGQLQVLDELIEIARKQVDTPASPQMYAASLNGLSKLLDARERVCPTDRTQLLLKLMEHYRNPQDLLADLKERGWGGITRVK